MQILWIVTRCRLLFARTAQVAVALTLFAPHLSSGAGNQVLGWNNLGMHCMDSDCSVFSILPPYNTIEAQLIVNGQLLSNGTGYQLTVSTTNGPRFFWLMQP